MSKVEDVEEEEEEVCVHCGGTPCKWEEFGDEIAQREQEMRRSLTVIGACDHDGSQIVDKNTKERLENKEMRKSMYRMFTYLKYGHLCRGVRIPIPECVVAKIREKYPDPDEEYMGFMESTENEIQVTTTSTPTPEPTSTSTKKTNKEKVIEGFEGIEHKKSQKKQVMITTIKFITIIFQTTLDLSHAVHVLIFLLNYVFVHLLQ